MAVRSLHQHAGDRRCFTSPGVTATGPTVLTAGQMFWTGLIDPPCYEASSAEDRLERGEAVAEVGHQASLPEERLERVESVEEV
eukprot:s10_g56.t1